MVNMEQQNIVARLNNVTEKVVVIDDIKYHVNSASGLRRDMTDMYIHVVDDITNEIMHPEEVLKIIDANYDYLANYTEKIGIHQVVLAQEVKNEDAGFDSNLAALIALAIVLFVGFITFFVVMCCLKYWFLSPNIRPMKLQESPRPVKPGSMVDAPDAPGGELISLCLSFCYG